jgi:pimeloyl-ACP methyl ester carboxylesterase
MHAALPASLAVGLSISGILALSASGLLWWLHRSLTPPRSPSAPTARPTDPQPLPVRLPTVRQRSLNALWLPADPTALAPALVLMHGWGGNAASLWRAACHLHAAGYAVLLPEARNHGQSDADTFSSLPRFAEDLDAALDWLKAQPSIDSGRLVAVGHSVGGAAVLLSASRRKDLMAVVSVSAFAHPERVMRRWMEARRIPYQPLGWLINRYVEWVIGHRFDTIAPLHTVRHVRCPVVLVHGTRDDVVPPQCARELQGLAPAGRVQLIEVPGTHEKFDDETALLERITRVLQRIQTSRIPSASVALEGVMV